MYARSMIHWFWIELLIPTKICCGHNEKENMYRHEYVLENFDVNNKTDDAYSEMKYARAPN